MIHTSTTRLWLWFSVPLVLLLLAAPLKAQGTADDEISVTTEISRSSVYVGDELTYQVVVRGASNPLQPEVVFPDLLRTQFNGRSSQSYTSMRIINGVRRSVTDRSFIFQFTLTPMGEGSIEIPAPRVEINGQIYSGDPVSFEALLPVRSDADEMEIIVGRSTLYQNETAEIECVWWIGDQTSEFNFSSSAFPESFKLTAVEQNTSGQYKVDFTLNGQPMTGVVETQEHNGQQMSRFSFRIAITPTEVGRFELGPLRAIFTRHSGTGSRFRAYVESEPVDIEVIHVPEQGRPANYNGAIGQFQLTARASNSSVNVGDPIQLTLRIRGEEPMIGVSDAPDLLLDPAFLDQFKVDSEGWREVSPRNRGMRLYETTIRALDDRVTQIPPIQLPSFNPDIGEYRIYRSEAIPLQVTAVREVTLADALVSPSQDTIESPRHRSIDRIELTTATPGLWAHGSREEILQNRGFNLAQALNQPGWQAALAVPPGLFLCACVVVGFRRTRDEELHRHSLAYRQAKRHSGTEALRVYLSAVMDIDLEATTANDAMNMPISDKLRAAVYQRLLTVEGGSQAEQPEHDVRDLLRKMHAACLEGVRKGRS